MTIGITTFSLHATVNPKSDGFGQNWTELDRFGRNWTDSDRIGRKQIMDAPQRFICGSLSTKTPQLCPKSISFTLLKVFKLQKMPQICFKRGILEVFRHDLR